MKTFYITTPIYYANSLPHLGHLYTTIVADVITRYKRQRGFDTFFLTGTDEHGINIQRAAEKNNRSPKEQADYISGELQRMFREFGLDGSHGGYDIFMRTTEPFHYEGVQPLWRTIASNKTPKGNENIYKGFYEGWFCAPCAEFKTEDEYVIVEGSDIPFCKIHERPLDKVSEESYFFRLSDYDETLLGIIDKDPARIRPEARLRNVVLDVAVSDAGYRIPADPRLLAIAFECMAHCILLLCTGEMSKLRIAVEGARVRPALIVEVSQNIASIDVHGSRRFFDRDFGEHPSGQPGALMAACLARIARLHGGRAGLRAIAPRGCALTLVVPRPMEG